MRPKRGTTIVKQALTYLPQVLVFVLAILGTLYKSIKVDKNDKVVPWKYRLPTLTLAGKLIVFFNSVLHNFPIHDMAKREDWQGRKGSII